MAAATLRATLASEWWLFIIRGVFAILFGVLALVWPGLALEILLLLFGFYAFIDGVFALTTALVRRTDHRDWPWHLLEGVAEIGIGLAVIVIPGITALALVYTIAGWALVTGVLEIVAAWRLRARVRDELLLALNGAISVILAIVLALFPGAGALGLVWLIGAYALLWGVIFIALGWRVRTL